MIDTDNPDPDKILKAIQDEEQKENCGRLKIFFGMSAGVGKTYAMLQEAHEKLKEGVNLIIGTINTHGRAETEALVKELPILPEKWIQYKDKAFSELDLDSILKKKPDLVLIDELAHTNVPGSKHLKRWQDVVEILDAGISVFTTLNVQHLESRKEIVESISNIIIHETVPDLILERASAIELVDITPQELLQRLKEGKVYLGDQSRIAAQNFFQENRLTALREIALRFTAEKVDHDLHEMMLFDKKWKTRERLMVGITPAPSSQHLIRATRRFAFELDAPWDAVYVNTGIKLSDEDQKKLNIHLQLAKDLGANVITTHELDIAEGLQRIAEQQSTTRLIIGRSTSRSLFNRILQNTLVDRLERNGTQMDILILRQDKILNLYQKRMLSPQFTSPQRSYWFAIGAVLLAILFGHLVLPWTNYITVGHIFLLEILILSLFLNIGPILFAAALSSLSWNYFFIPPVSNFTVHDFSDKILLVLYFLTALIVGMLNTRIRQKDSLLSRREKNIEILFALTDEATKARDLQDFRERMKIKLKQLFGGEFDILIRGLNGELNLDSSLSALKEETDQAAALWSFLHMKPSGRGSDTLPSAKASFFPIKSTSILGILVYQPKTISPAVFESEDLSTKITKKLAPFIDHFITQEKEQYSLYTREIEKLNNAIFHSLSKGFYAPLETIATINKKWTLIAKTEEERSLALSLNKAAKNLKFIVDNILTISKLESGFITFNKQKHKCSEIILECIEEVKNCIDSSRSISWAMPDLELFIFCDRALIKIAINNVLMNALNYSPQDTLIEIQAKTKEDFLEIAILDEGPGIPEEFVPLIFEKFYRIPGDKMERIGLGLAIVKSVIDLHGGYLKVKKRDVKGTVFSLFLPMPDAKGEVSM